MELGEDETLHTRTRQFVIQDYSKKKGRGIGVGLAIDVFFAGGHQWVFYFMPDGIFLEDNLEFVSVYFKLVDKRKEQVKASFQLKLVDQSGKGNHFYSLKNSTPIAITGGVATWRFDHFYKRASLDENSDFLKDDCLVIIASFGVVVPKMSNSWRVYIPESDMGKDIGTLLEKPVGCDVVFNVAGQKFHAHKVVLAARSPVFRAQFFVKDEVEMIEKGEIVFTDEGELVVPDMKPEVFKAVLHFIYTGTLLEDDMLVEFISSSETFDETLVAEAEAYGLEGFKLRFQSYLWDNLTTYNAVKIFAYADRHGATELKSACLSSLFQYLASVMQYNGFKYLKENFSSLHSEILEIEPGLEEKYCRGGSIQNPQTRPSDIRYNLGVLLENPVGSDVVFKVNEEYFHAHKVVLAARSPVFRDQFFENDKAKTVAKSEIVVSDVEPEVFKAMLHFIYRDELLDDNELNRSTASSSKSSVFDTFAGKLFVADKYGLDRLRLMCQSDLCKDLSVISVAENP